MKLTDVAQARVSNKLELNVADWRSTGTHRIAVSHMTPHLAPHFYQQLTYSSRPLRSPGAPQIMI